MTSSSDQPGSTAPAVEPPWWPRPKPGRRRQPLTRDAIVRAAVEILDAEGADALTVRRLGEALNTGSATLYWHIGSKNELAELVYDHVMGEVELPQPDAARWQEQLKHLGREVYRVLLRHRDLARLSLGAIPAGPNMLRIMEWSLEVARAGGVPDEAAAYFGDMLGRFVDASVLEVTSSGGPPLEMVSDYFRDLPADRFPNLHRLSRAMFAGTQEERFEFGLDLFLRGLADYSATTD